MSGESPEKEENPGPAIAPTSPGPEGDTSESSSKRPKNPAELRESLRTLEERCVAFQERFRLLVKPDIFRKLEEAREMADEISRRMDKVRTCGASFIRGIWDFLVLLRDIPYGKPRN